MRCCVTRETPPRRPLEAASPIRIDSELIGAAVIPTLVDLSKEAT